MVDIIIRGKNGHQLTEECIASIRKTTPADSYRIILVDDGSDPAYEFDADYRIRHSQSKGAVSATNSGLSMSLTLNDSQYVLVMDNDTLVPDGDTGWLERMVSELEQYPDCAAVGATSGYASSPQNILYVLETYTGDWSDEKSGKAGTKENPMAAVFISFCVLMRKEAVRRAGMWDERYNPGNWEDTDYAIKLRTMGYSIRVARSVYIHHKGSSTFGDDIMRLLAENKIKFLEKWGIGRSWDMGILEDQDIGMVIRQIESRSRTKA